MKRELGFRVVLPENYETSEACYPVLYLLHGIFGSGDNWLELTELKKYLSGYELVVILPDGGDRWYSDSATVIEEKFESAFVSELVPAIEKKYRVCKSREKRAIAGLSMGGFGALKLALKRPDLFAFAGSMSGAFNAPHIVADDGGQEWKELLPSISEVFGEINSPARIENDLFRIIQAIRPDAVSAVPYLYLDCGTEDAFLEVNRKFSELLKEKKIAFEYAEFPGGHDWNYWNRQILTILTRVDKVLKTGAVETKTNLIFRK